MAGKKTRSLKTLRKKLRSVLPEKIAQAIRSYDEFVESGAPEDAKGFSAHHSACKAAMAHIDALLKLAKWSEEENHNLNSDGQNIRALLVEAKEALSSMEDDDDE